MNIALVASKGGHLGQIKIIFSKEVIGKNKCILITESKKYQKKTGYFDGFKTYFFKKDYLSIYPWRYLNEIIKFITIFKKEKIEIIVTNGAQISIPAIISGKILGIKTIFFDTIIRVKTPNWSARICYFFADIFLVQHEWMINKYGKKAKYVGGIL